MKTLFKLTLALLVTVTLLSAPVHAEPSGTVNVNTASAEQLTLLPRIGPSLAGKILDYRKENGAFKKAEDLLLVSGIGDKLFSLLEPFVRTTGETTLKVKIKAGALAKETQKDTSSKKQNEAKPKAAAEGAAEDGR